MIAIDLNPYAGWLLLAGVVLLIVWHYRLWQQDRARICADAPAAVVLRAAPKVSVLVAAWNEAALIERHIQSFLALRYPNKELILCAGGSDDTYTLAAAAAQRSAGSVTVLQQQPGEGKQRALRRSFAQANGELIFLTDADCLYSDRAFEHTLAPLINDGAAAASGGYQPLPEQKESPLVLFQASVDNYATSLLGEWRSGFSGANCALRADVIAEVKGFEVEARSGTDYTLARQVILHGYRIRHVKTSHVETEFPDTLRLYFYKRSRWVRNLLTIGFATRDWGQVRGALQSMLIAVFMLVGLTFWLWAGALVTTVWLLLLLHGLLSRARYVLALRLGFALETRQTIAAVVTGWLLLGFDFAVWISAFIQAINPRWRSIWK